MKKNYIILLALIVFAAQSCKKAELTSTTPPATATGCLVSSITTYDSISKVSSTITMQYDSQNRLTKYTNTINNGAGISETDNATYNDDKKSATISFTRTYYGTTAIGTKTIYFDDNGNTKSFYQQYKTSTDPEIMYDTTLYTYNSDRYLIAETSSGGGIDQYEYWNGNQISSSLQFDNGSGSIVTAAQQLFEFSDQLNNISYNINDMYTFFYKTGLTNKNLVTKITNKIYGTVNYVQTYNYQTFNSLNYPTKFSYNRVGMPSGNGFDSKTVLNFEYTCK